MTASPSSGSPAPRTPAPGTPASPTISGRAAALARLQGQWVRFAANKTATLGLILFGSLAVIAIAAPLLPLIDPAATTPSIARTPPFSANAILGTDHLGRDLLSRLIWGTRTSLAVGLTATAVAALIGSTIGLIAAFYGRWVDAVFMRSIDTLMAFPYLLLALAIIAVLGPGLTNALLAIAVVNIPFFARAVRGQALAIKSMDYIDAARLSGFSDFRIIAGELLPNVLPVIIVTMSTTLSWMILETAGLSFLGLGAQPPHADLGSMLGDGRSMIYTAPWVAVLPGMVILALAVGINLVGDGLRDLLDPRLKAGALAKPEPATRRNPPRGSTASRPPAFFTDPPDTSGDTSGPTAAVLPSLAITDLTTTFATARNDLTAVNQVSFSLYPGEAYGLVGESGSGKSVTALSICGLVASPPGTIAGGSIWYRDRDSGPIDLADATPRALTGIRGRRIAYIFQDPLTTLNPVMRIGDQVAEGLIVRQHLTTAAARRAAIDLLDAVGLPDPKAKAESFPHELSGGQRQRVVIAIAVANKPDIIVADEPTTALDVTTQRRVLDMLDTLRRDRGAALLLISHDLGVVSDICDRVGVMYAGRIVEEGLTRDVLDRPSHPYTRRLLECIPSLDDDRPIRGIPGLPPAIDALPPGCAFADRCDQVTAECRRGTIDLRPVDSAHDLPRSVDGSHMRGSKHQARCIFAGEPS